MASSPSLSPARPDGPSRLRRLVEEFGDWALFTLSTLGWCVRRRPAPGTLIQSLYTVGVRTAPVVLLTGLFIGMVLAIHTLAELQDLGMGTRSGASINAAIVRELGPVLVATMLAGRVGSAMAAEMATMRVSEQVDALACLGVHPTHYLVVPRFLACVLLIPLLTVVANFAGVLGGGLISVNMFGVDGHHYWSHAGDSVGWWDLMGGSLVKPLFFGAAIALVSCHRGLNSQAGAAGVGRASTEGFVASFVAILAIDFLLALFLNSLHIVLWGFPPGGKGL